MATGDRIVSITIDGLRALEKVTLDLEGLTVLVGENGGGKSSIIEALELLRRAASGSLIADFNGIHGGAGLLTHGVQVLSLCAVVRLDAETEGAQDARYFLGVDPARRGLALLERLDIRASGAPEWTLLFQSDGDDANIWSESGPRPLDKKQRGLLRSDLLLSALSGPLSPHPAIPRVREALARIEVHLPFEVTPSWAARAFQRQSAARGSVVLQATDRLECFGRNLANVFFALRNDKSPDHWQETMELVRIGLGQEIESVNTRADLAGGSVAITLKIAGQDAPLPAFSLADGQLAYLCFVALVRMGDGRSLLAFDEPEHHLHPELLVRVVQMLEAIADEHPVILATHSDVLLDALTDPVRSVRVCELEGGRTRLRHLDAAALAGWMKDYRGVGQIRGEGYLPALLRPISTPTDGRSLDGDMG